MTFSKIIVPAAWLALVFLAPVFGQPLAQADSIVVQVMSVNNQAAAAAEVERLLAQGVPSFQRAEDVAEAGLRYRVYLGPFDSAGEANGAAEALKGSGLIGDYIVRPDKPAAVAVVLPQPVQAAPAVPVVSQPAGGDYWPPPPGQALAVAQPGGQDYWPPPPGQAPAVAQPGGQDYWPPPPGQAPAVAQPGGQDYWPPPPGQAPVQEAAQVPPVAPVMPPAAQPAAPGEPALAPSAMGASQAPPGVPVMPPATQPAAPGEPALAPSAQAGISASSAAEAERRSTIPAKPAGAMKIQGFEVLSDLSSSMRRLSPCQGGLVKQEAVNTLLRKMNHRIPSHPYMAALRVFGYKQAWTRRDYTTLYFGPGTYDRGAMEEAVGRLFAADSISPFGFALTSSESELEVMKSPRAVLMFADFEETTDSGAPVDKAKAIRRKYGDDTRIYTFYVTRQTAAERLARDIAKAGGGKDFGVCDMLGSEEAFEAMMTEIFGPADIPPCKDSDRDGVCDESDRCPLTPAGAPVDERGCWIAAYSQFFDFDKAEVKSAFHPRIQFAAELISKNPQIGKVTIAGHTDGKGTDAYNMDLGRRRAEAVRDLLVKFGAPADRLAVESFGKSRPIDTNDTEEGRAKNRRVEFHVGDVPS
ncbi:MAG: OmpA family protein [Deltaproteobacteria bacterium]|jgi:OOP family OmpA-OmpF porin|nr:OmpA family protein [Deltaproteobacteria bacterium]